MILLPQHRRFVTLKLNKFTQYIVDNWQGNQPLWVPFWLHGFGMGTLLGAFFTPILLERLTVLAHVLPRTAQANFAGPVLALYSTLALLGFWLTYYIWNLVSTWRCAANTACSIRKWCARWFALFVFASYWALVITFVAQSLIKG